MDLLIELLKEKTNQMKLVQILSILLKKNSRVNLEYNEQSSKILHHLQKLHPKEIDLKFR